jgi:hypothetical protein
MRIYASSTLERTLYVFIDLLKITTKKNLGRKIICTTTHLLNNQPGKATLELDEVGSSISYPWYNVEHF